MKRILMIFIWPDVQVLICTLVQLSTFIAVHFPDRPGGQQK